jgi:3-O-methylgallate 3,4-dioxygenase
MADIVLGLGSSHTPQLSSSALNWAAHAERDRANDALLGPDGEFHDYAEVAKWAPDDIEDRIAPDAMQEADERAQRAVAELARALREAGADTVVVIGDDQEELFDTDCIPALAIFDGETLWDRPVGDGGHHIPDDIRPALWALHADEPDAYPVASELAQHIIGSLVDEGFDVARCSRQPHDRTLGHAFTYPRRRLGMPDSTRLVPIFVNTYFGPNVPSPGRCLALGSALRRAVASWPGHERIAVVASGGLSHFVVLEDFDRRLLAALGANDENALSALPRPFFRSGTSEGLCWLVAGAALQDLTMTLVDYIPAYRSPAGTGTGLGFAIWQ